MSIKTIKNGILKQDWDLVIKGYNDITGESLSLNSVDDTSIDNNVDIKRKEKKVKKTKSIKAKQKVTRIKKEKHIILPQQSEDGMQFITDESEPKDDKFFKKLAIKKPKNQSRPSPQANISCDGCYKKMYSYEVSKTKINDAGNIVGRYCNKCVVNRKDN